MRRRASFTITELLVAMALIVFVMSILATAFSEGMRTFRGLKGLGDMNQRMRVAVSQLRDDLQKRLHEIGRDDARDGFHYAVRAGSEISDRHGGNPVGGFEAGGRSIGRGGAVLLGSD